MSPEYQSTLRMIHYLPMENAKPEDFTGWRAGAHTDFDCLTLLHQRTGQGGLQLCPGKEATGGDLEWTDVPPLPGVVTCNIGDMLMRWSDDQLQSTLHRVRMPRQDEYLGPRYSLPFFCQANKDVIIQGPGKKYDPITAQDYLLQRIAANSL
jgi:isopenicillin N synthase-like dioxygenase